MQIFNQTQHISEEALGLHALDDLPERRSKQVTAHLSACHQCRGLFKDAQEFIGIVRLVAKKCSASAPSVAISHTIQ